MSAGVKSLGERLRPCLKGGVSFDQLDTHAQEATMILVHFRASEILDLPTNATMSRALDELPPTIRELVRVECRRLYQMRGL